MNPLDFRRQNILNTYLPDHNLFEKGGIGALDEWINEKDFAEAAEGLQKAEELGILGGSEDDIQKGRVGMAIGSKAVWKGVSYIKTATGWKPVGKHRGHVKANHDHIHANEEKDKDHHAMVLDAGKMESKEWQDKHGDSLHGKYKEVHDYLHKPKKEKKVEESREDYVAKVKAASDEYDKADKKEDTSKEDEEKYFHHSTMSLATTGAEKEYHSKKHLEGYYKVGENKELDQRHINFLKKHVHIDDNKTSDENAAVYAAKHKDEHLGNEKKEVKSETPITDAFQEKQKGINKDKVFNGSEGLAVGDYIQTKSGSMGFVKKVSPKNISIETLYGGYGGNDSMLMELKIKKEDIQRYLKPKESVVEKKEELPIGTKSPDGKHIKTANGWEYIKEGKKPAKVEEAKANVTSIEQSIFDKYQEKVNGKFDIQKVSELADKIAAHDERIRNISHFAEALMYEEAKLNPESDSLDTEDIEAGLRNDKYYPSNFERKHELGLLAADKAEAAMDAVMLFRQVGGLDIAAQTLIRVFHNKALQELKSEDQVKAITTVLNSAKDKTPISIAESIGRYVKGEKQEAKVEDVTSKEETKAATQNNPTSSGNENVAALSEALKNFSKSGLNETRVAAIQALISGDPKGYQKLGKYEKFDNDLGGDFGDEETPIKVARIEKTVKPTGAIESMKDVVSTDDLRPAMTGVYHDAKNQCLVATDAHVLCVLPQKIEGETRIMDSKGKEIDARYPDYKVVIPENNDFHIKDVSVKNLANQVNGLVAANKMFSERGQGILAVIKTPVGNVDFNAEKLNAALSFMQKNGVNDVQLEISPSESHKTGMIIRSKTNPDMFALVMPIMTGNATLINELEVGGTNSFKEGFTPKEHYSLAYHKRELAKAKKKGDEWDIDYHAKRVEKEQAIHNETVKRVAEVQKNMKPAASIKTPAVPHNESAKKANDSIKAKYPDAVVVHKTGDTHEVFGKDAENFSKQTGTKLNTLPDGTSHTSFESTDITEHLKKMIKAGHKVALSENKAKVA